MRAKEFVADFEGINIAVEEAEDDLMVRAMAGGKEMGHAYFVKDGKTLLPQDLEIDPRYQGQGIARVLYDYTKSLGYQIRRSNQQTDAGKAFWQRHKPGQNVWEAETQTATAEQIWSYIKRIHPPEQQGGGFLKKLIMRYPQYELREVPLSSLQIPDIPPDDQTDYQPKDDAYGRGLDVDQEHAGEYSIHYVDRRPIVVDSQGNILDGNHRAWAAAELLNRNTIKAWVAKN